MDKPISLSIEEYMERIGKGEMLVEQRLNGTTAEDLYNVISKPKHYMLFDTDAVTGFAYMHKGIEVRDVIKELVDKCYTENIPENASLFISDYVQLLQYIMRFMDKNGVEDLKKARWYLDKMIESY